LTVHGQLPARLTAEQVAWVLNCQVHDIPVLVAARLLKPLGNPSKNGPKHFATVNVVEAGKDAAWLGRMTVALSQYWRKANSRRQGFRGEAAETGTAA
jgi:hypothetical protein